MNNKVFHDKFQMACSFTGKGIYFCNAKRNLYFPYGCLDSLSLSLLGVLQAVCRSQVGCFTVARADKAELKELVKQAKEAMKTAPAAEPVMVDLEKYPVDPSLDREEQLRQYKALYIQGVFSKEQYDLMKYALD